VTKLFAVVAIAVWRPQAAVADTITQPDVPPGLDVEVGNKPFLVGHAFGTQNYICLPSGAGFAYSLFTPEATLFDDGAEQIITHFFSPNPDPSDNGTIRATWEDSRDSSRFFGAVVQASTDSRFVARGAIAWVLLSRAGVQAGPTGGDRLTKTTFVQRVNTAGGVAPSTGCASAADVGRKAFVPYTADYVFYKGKDGT
jgi:hypothetical protein